MPCSIMAAGTGSNASSTPIRIIPPAIPRMPEMNDVMTTLTEIAAREKTEIIVTPFVGAVGECVDTPSSLQMSQTTYHRAEANINLGYDGGKWKDCRRSMPCA